MGANPRFARCSLSIPGPLQLAILSHRRELPLSGRLLGLGYGVQSTAVRNIPGARLNSIAAAGHCHAGRLAAPPEGLTTNEGIAPGQLDMRYSAAHAFIRAPHDSLMQRVYERDLQLWRSPWPLQLAGPKGVSNLTLIYATEH